MKKMVSNNILKTVFVFFVLTILIFSEVGFIVAENVQFEDIGMAAGNIENGLGINKNKGFSSIIDNILDVLLNPLSFLGLVPDAPGPNIPGAPICRNGQDCINKGFKNPAPYCDGNFRVIPKVFCFNRRTAKSFCGIHNAGINRRKCGRNRFCRELDINDDGITDNVVCSRGDPPGPIPPVPPIPPIPPGPPFPGDPNDPNAPPIPPPGADLSCKKSKDCSLPTGEFEVSCEDRDGDGVADELVRKSACCLGSGANKNCNICDKVSNCNYGCGWREDMNPPRAFCCTKKNSCGGASCDNDGICEIENGEIPGICDDCLICNNDGICDVERGENANNCEDCQGKQIDCCIDSDCGERKYECDGNLMISRTPKCKKVCTPQSSCAESYAKISCPSGKTCQIGNDGRANCVEFGSGVGVGNLLASGPNQNNNDAGSQGEVEEAIS